MKLYLSIPVCLLMTAAPRSVGATDNPAETNQPEGEAFLAADAKKAGVSFFGARSEKEHKIHNMVTCSYSASLCQTFRGMAF